MHCVAVIALAALLHDLERSQRIGYEPGPMFGRRSCLRNCSQHEGMGSHPLLCCGRDGPLLEFVGQFE